MNHLNATSKENKKKTALRFILIGGVNLNKKDGTENLEKFE